MKSLPAATAASWLVVAGAAVAQGLSEGRDELILRSLRELHEERFDQALATCAALRERWPDDPVGYLNAANVYQTMMRDYRVRLFEREFDALLDRALPLAERRAAERGDAESVFLLGTARGYRALHRFRRGDWIPALGDGIGSVRLMSRARALDSTFADPLLALALYDYWKGRKLGLGIGLFSGGRQRAASRLEAVRATGRYVAVDATYGLQTVLLQEGDYAGALRANGWLYERYPGNPVCLYHRALILEGLGRSTEALDAWERLVERINAFRKPSHGFLAECHLHRARIHRLMERTQPGREHGPRADAALVLAADHARRRDAAAEMEGPMASFEAITEAITAALRQSPPGPARAGSR